MNHPCVIWNPCSVEFNSAYKLNKFPGCKTFHHNGISTSVRYQLSVRNDEAGNPSLLYNSPVTHSLYAYLTADGLIT